MKKIIAIVAVAAIIVSGTIFGKIYYDNRYAVADIFYTQIPLDEVNEDSWIKDANGVKQEYGKEYELIGYNDKGESDLVTFSKLGMASDYYAPGTYIKVEKSKTLVVKESVINENEVPVKAQAEINELGTRV